MRRRVRFPPPPPLLLVLTFFLFFVFFSSFNRVRRIAVSSFPSPFFCPTRGQLTVRFRYDRSSSSPLRDGFPFFHYFVTGRKKRRLLRRAHTESTSPLVRLPLPFSQGMRECTAFFCLFSPLTIRVREMSPFFFLAFLFSFFFPSSFCSEEINLPPPEPPAKFKYGVSFFPPPTRPPSPFFPPFPAKGDF